MELVCPLLRNHIHGCLHAVFRIRIRDIDFKLLHGTYWGQSHHTRTETVRSSSINGVVRRDTIHIEVRSTPVHGPSRFGV